eukprot:CAMPEP_0170584338 /NCGR_PEP_ID=MMETSP0224-20130122/8635_1 /TAXON_ID=285029 /ORGANISM="Togula jolla, Strain CCCM 725" /LENGTH=453 /DNA_ID=CAMNT_0010907765 /DNA_START=33 /DNA_END=1391 /DNA_ORIENTATION=-
MSLAAEDVLAGSGEGDDQEPLEAEVERLRSELNRSQRCLQERDEELLHLRERQAAFRRSEARSMRLANRIKESNKHPETKDGQISYPASPASQVRDTERQPSPNLSSKMSFESADDFQKTAELERRLEEKEKLLHSREERVLELEERVLTQSARIEQLEKLKSFAGPAAAPLAVEAYAELDAPGHCPAAEETKALESLASVAKVATFEAEHRLRVPQLTQPEVKKHEASRSHVVRGRPGNTNLQTSSVAEELERERQAREMELSKLKDLAVSQDARIRALLTKDNQVGLDVLHTLKPQMASLCSMLDGLIANHQDKAEASNLVVVPKLTSGVAEVEVATVQALTANTCPQAASTQTEMWTQPMTHRPMASPGHSFVAGPEATFPFALASPMSQHRQVWSPPRPHLLSGPWRDGVIRNSPRVPCGGAECAGGLSAPVARSWRSLRTVHGHSSMA